MKNQFSNLIKEKLKEDKRSIRWLAQKVGISNVHMGYILNGKQSWRAETLQKTAKILKIPVIEAYLMAGFIAESDLEEHALGKKMNTELVKLFAVPGVREICNKVKLLFEKYPHDLNEIVRDLIVTLNKELAFRKMRDQAVRSKPE